MKLLLALSVGITLIVGVGIYMWMPAAAENSADVASAAQPETPKNSDPENSKEIAPLVPMAPLSTLVQEELHTENQAEEPAKCNSAIAFQLFERDAKAKDFSSIDAAIAALRDAKSEATISLIFNKCAIASIDEKIFRRFLARVGDYIFVQRMLFIEDMAKNVLPDPNFGRVTEDEVEKRGNVLLVNLDDQHVALEIRGLANQVGQVEIVAKEMLFKAISDPQKIIDQPTCPAAKLSERLKEHLSKSVAPNAAMLIDALQDSAVYDEDRFSPFGIDGNLVAFLPSVEFRELPNITAMQIEALRKHYLAFYEYVDEHIIKKIDPNAEATDALLTRITDDYFAGLVLRARQWAKDTDIASMIKNSILSH